MKPLGIFISVNVCMACLDSPSFWDQLTIKCFKLENIFHIVVDDDAFR